MSIPPSILLDLVRARHEDLIREARDQRKAARRRRTERDAGRRWLALRPLADRLARLWRGRTREAGPPRVDRVPSRDRPSPAACPSGPVRLSRLTEVGEPCP